MLIQDEGRFPFSPNSENFGQKSNGTDHFGSVRPEYLGPALKVVHFDRSGHLGGEVGRTEMSLSIWQNCCPQNRSFESCLREQ